MTLIIADIAEIHSAAPMGLYLFSYMFVYLLIRAMNRYLLIARLGSMINITFFATFVLQLTQLTMLRLLELKLGQWQWIIFSFAMGILVNGFLSIWVFKLLGRFDWISHKDARARQTADEEFQLGEEGL